MKWIEATIKTKSEEIDEICETLEQLGVQGVSIEDEEDFQSFLKNNRQYWDFVDEELEKRFMGVSRVKFYFIDNPQGRASLRKVEEVLGKEAEIALIDDEDWEYTWRKHYEPIEIGNRLLVVPEWLNPEPGARRVLRLDPGLAFGTGSHATTRLCLEAMDSMVHAGKKVLDIGCGSGILGIGALVLGCDSVVGCDVDPNAPTAVRANAKLNGIDERKMKIYAGNILTDEGMRKFLGSGYDLVLANIVADVIIPLLKIVRQFMTEGGEFVCSGIIDSRVPEVEETLRRNEFEIVEHKRLEEWNAYVVK